MFYTFAHLCEVFPNEKGRELFKNIEKAKSKNTCPYLAEQHIRFVRRYIRLCKGSPWMDMLIVGYYQGLLYCFIRKLFYALQNAFETNNVEDKIASLKNLTMQIPDFYEDHPIWQLFEQRSSLSLLRVFTQQLTKNPTHN